MMRFRHKETGLDWDGRSVYVERNGKRYQVFNPSEKILTEAGYEQYTPAVPEPPSEEEVARDAALERMADIERELQGMDYLTSKVLDGEDMSKYDAMYGGDWKQYRRGLREEYNRLELSLPADGDNDTE